MMWARYPNGQVVQYNDAGFLEYTDVGWKLYTRKNGRWIATIQASAGVIIEATKACRVENPIAGINHDSALNYVLEHLKSFPDHKLHQLKNALRSFDSRQRRWKNQ